MVSVNGSNYPKKPNTAAYEPKNLIPSIPPTYIEDTASPHSFAKSIVLIYNFNLNNHSSCTMNGIHAAGLYTGLYRKSRRKHWSSVASLRAPKHSCNQTSIRRR